jgi:hypothetical protein
VLPLRYPDLQYELLVCDIESERRRLVEFLGPSCKPAGLDFHRSTKRTVQTASAWQVRQPLYNRSVGRGAITSVIWDRY